MAGRCGGAAAAGGAGDDIAYVVGRVRRGMEVEACVD